jgi:hypothetical protein
MSGTRPESAIGSTVAGGGIGDEDDHRENSSFTPSVRLALALALSPSLSFAHTNLHHPHRLQSAISEEVHELEHEFVHRKLDTAELAGTRGVSAEPQHHQAPPFSSAAGVRQAAAGAAPSNASDPTAGSGENPWPSKEALAGKKVAIFTSGGDAPGMNAAYRAAAGVCLSAGVDMYAIYNGYSGLVEGGAMIRKVTWADINDIIHRGGTVIGSARCMEFKTRDGRLRAAENLVNLGVNCLIAIGGDGTLTGANLFKTEWQDLLHELHAQGRITAEALAQFAYLAVVGMVGSIDNDMCGFSMTIGCDTALHRIMDAVDALVT